MSRCGKPLCKMLATAISPQYNCAMPDTQFGATSQRVADNAFSLKSAGDKSSCELVFAR